MNARAAVKAIEKEGILLVFPLQNQKEPKSLWSHFFPRSAMRWEWDEGGDNRVGELWHLREQLSRSNKVVYSKWYRGRATFFSREVFTQILADIEKRVPSPRGLTVEAARMLSLLKESSPQSTKELKRAAHLEGKFMEPTYSKATQELWRRLLIVGHGEVDDGAFPSLAMGSTQHLFEDLWKRAREDKPELTYKMPAPIEKFYLRLTKDLDQKLAQSVSWKNLSSV